MAELYLFHETEVFILSLTFKPNEIITDIIRCKINHKGNDCELIPVTQKGESRTLSMTFCGYEFEGPFNIRTTIVPINRVAVFVIIQAAPDGQLYIRGVGVSSDAHWERNLDDSYMIYLRYMPSTQRYTPADRQRIANNIKQFYNIP